MDVLTFNKIFVQQHFVLSSRGMDTTVPRRPLEIIDLALHISSLHFLRSTHCIYLGKLSVVKQVLHNQKVHLRDFVCLATRCRTCLAESDLIASKDFAQ